MKSMRVLFLLFTLINTIACSQEKTRLNPKIDDSGSTRVGQSGELCAIRFVRSGVCLDWKWQLEPTRRDKGILEFQTYQLDDSQPQPQAKPYLFSWIPEVVLWMPSMGHGSSPTVNFWSVKGSPTV
jgi:hypothetical protein